MGLFHILSYILTHGERDKAINNKTNFVSSSEEIVDHCLLSELDLRVHKRNF